MKEVEDIELEFMNIDREGFDSPCEIFISDGSEKKWLGPSYWPYNIFDRNPI